MRGGSPLADDDLDPVRAPPPTRTPLPETQPYPSMMPQPQPAQGGGIGRQVGIYRQRGYSGWDVRIQHGAPESGTPPHTMRHHD